MILSLIIAIVAVSISIVAAYYSIVGLAAIFAASALAIIIMGITLEVGKVATVIWLHTHWHRASMLLKLYLVPGVIILMLITSMGIFGFLSKAHIEQTSASDTSQAQVEQVIVEIDRQTDIIARSEGKIVQLESGSLTADTAIQEQIDKEQERIDSAYTRIQPAIAEQKAIIGGQTKLFEDQIVSLDVELGRLQSYIDAGDTKKAQQLIGEKSPGGWGPKTSETARLWRLERTDKKAVLLIKLESAATNPEVQSARKEIKRLRGQADSNIADSTTLINRLRGKLATEARTVNTDELIEQQYVKIKEAQLSVDELTETQYLLQAEYRKLEAEVGPIKYIAELIYGDDAGNDRALLEDAVRWVIIILVAVFDPLAIMLVLAASSSYQWYRADLKTKEPEVDLETVARLEQTLVEEAEKHDSTMRIMGERNAEMNDLREETQGIIDEANMQLTASAEDITTLEQELRATEKVRDGLQLEVERILATADKDTQQLITDRNDLLRELDIVQEEISKVPALELEVDRLMKISSTSKTPINIQQAPGNEASLRHKIQLLNDRITSMITLSDFDLEKAQELVEVKAQKLALEIRLQNLLPHSEKQNDS